MNRYELTDIIYRRHGGISRKEAADIVNLILSKIKNRLMSGERVEITGFGSFQIRRKKGRKGRNPRTGEAIYIPSRRALSFKPSRVLKEDLNS
jgi:integration host factor subunit alpha